MNMFWTEEKLAARIHELDGLRYRFITPVTGAVWAASGNGPGERPPADADWQPVQAGTHWSGRDIYRWIRMDVSIPGGWDIPVGLFDFGSNNAGNTAGFESLLYVDGKPYQGVDANHREVFLPQEKAGNTLLLEFRLWSGLGGYQTMQIIEHRINRSDIALLDRATDRLYYLGQAALDTVAQLDSNNPVRQDILDALNRCITSIDWADTGSDSFYKDTAEAAAELDRWCREYKKNSTSADPVRITCVGHTHIDVAWLWRLRHTREKAARSFSTALRLMEQYPEFVFLQTQPQLYDFVKQDYPDLYERIKKVVARGKWETGGAMWLEADCNIPSGESLVRQILAGITFFRKEFGEECRYLWLPDVFGYSWALPQILTKCGIKVFVTTKISWNQYNRMPHDTFIWRGIDGSEILTHFITTPDPSCSEGSFYYTYNGTVSAATVFGIWNAYRDKNINRNLLIAYGYGDGGGGATRDMIETERALSILPGIPEVTTGRADTYFEELEKTVQKAGNTVPVWDGELYLELHRGTYTSQAKIKQQNRKTELLLRRTEISSVIAKLTEGQTYPSEILDKAWHILLRNQFHDIIPGSAIHEVYEDAASEFAEAGKLIRTILDSSLGSADITSGIASGVILDAAGRKRTGPVLLPAACAQYSWYYDGTKLESQRTSEGLYLDFPGLPGPGICMLQGRQKTEHNKQKTPFFVRGTVLETPYYRVTWNNAGQLVSIYDRTSDRQVLAADCRGNILQVFEDRPQSRHEAWDIDIYYQDKMEEITALTECTVEENGPLLVSVRFIWNYRSSKIMQHMVLYAKSRRIDFRTEADWHESRRLLKVAFPVLIRNTEATYDIQFGNIRRPTHWNTSWDLAKFEVPAQQWADISETGYGVSLLNDCKYGYDIRDSQMRLTLIKSAKIPDPDADQGLHSFTYALLPHSGNWTEGNTVAEAATLNDPPVFRFTNRQICGGTFCPFTVSAEAVCIDAIKQAENGTRIILRIHECYGSRTPLSIQAGFSVHSWQECNLLEEPFSAPVSGTDNLEIVISPYEIRTFLVTPEHQQR
jgi:alpha-mannosidase